MKRRLFKLVLFLLLGAIVNVVAAWGCATAHGDIMQFGYTSRLVYFASGFKKVRQQLYERDFPKNSYVSVKLKKQGHGLLVISMEIQAYDSGESWVRLWAEMPNPHLIAAKQIGTGIEQRIILNGKFRKQLRLHHSPFYGHFGLAQRIVGWPLKSLYYIPSNPNPNSAHKRDKDEKVWRLTNESSKLFPSINELILPYGMLWPGFAINTIFYAAILWLLTLGPFALRRTIRSKRGLCLKCGYDLRHVEHEKCPECGNELSARAES